MLSIRLHIQSQTGPHLKGTKSLARDVWLVPREPPDGRTRCVRCSDNAPMHVRETTLGELVQGEKQFAVPLFQRPYTWNRRDHLKLWNDILDQYEAFDNQARPSHFLGSFVLAPVPSAASAPVKGLLLVDG